MFKIGLLIAVAGTIVLLTGGGLMAYSRSRSSDGAGVFRRAFEGEENSQFLSVVATVNGAEIRGETLAFYVAGSAASLEANPEMQEIIPGFEPPTPRDFLESLIDFELVYQEAQRRGLLCSDDEVRELAEYQMGLVDREALEVWADHLGVSVDQLSTDPEFLRSYARACARSRLIQAAAPEEALANPDAVSEVWDELVASLRDAADIEILDRSLQ